MLTEHGGFAFADTSRVNPQLNVHNIYEGEYYTETSCRSYGNFAIRETMKMELLSCNQEGMDKMIYFS